jgi:NADPH-dependent curcumin reductase CurA
MSGPLQDLELGAVVEGRAVGEVIASGDPGFGVGDILLNHSGWRDVALIDLGRDRAPERVAVDDDTPMRWYLGPLGAAAMTAYVGLIDVAELGEGDTVFVSAAAGAVGSMAVQIAKLRGHRVVGSAGSGEKVRFVVDRLGADEGFCYRDGEVEELLAAAAPDGIDVYFDNVGGDHLEAALSSLRMGGRVALCGSISNYNAEGAVPGPSNLYLSRRKALTLRGFMVGQYGDRTAAFEADMRGWLSSGELVFPETVFDGIDGVVEGFIAMLTGATIGKALVRLD